MILGMSLSTYTLAHVLLSLVGIGAGLVAMFGLLAAKRLDRLDSTVLDHHRRNQWAVTT